MEQAVILSLFVSQRVASPPSMAAFPRIHSKTSDMRILQSILTSVPTKQHEHWILFHETEPQKQTCLEVFCPWTTSGLPPRSVTTARNAKSAFLFSSANFLIFFPVLLSHKGISLLLPLRRIHNGEFYGFFEPHLSTPLKRVGAHWFSLCLCLLWEDVLTSVFMGGIEKLSQCHCTLRTRINPCAGQAGALPHLSQLQLCLITKWPCSEELYFHPSWWNTNHRKGRSPRLKSGAGGTQNCQLRSCFAPELAL